MSRVITVRGRRLLINDRKDWLLDLPFDGPPYVVADVHTELGHYPGAGDTWKPPLDTAAFIRFSHELYLRDRGFSLGYGGVIGRNPIDWDADPVVTDMWIVRGFDFRNAANNGDFPPYSTTLSPWNGKTHTWQVMCSTDHPPTDDQLLQFRYALAWSDDVHGELLDLKGHRDSDFTDCPGPLYEHITSGKLAQRPPIFDPNPDPPPTHSVKDNDMPLRAAKVLNPNGTVGGFYVGAGPGTPAVHVHADNADARKEMHIYAVAGLISVNPIGEGPKLVFSWDDVKAIAKGNVRDHVGDHPTLE